MLVNEITTERNELALGSYSSGTLRDEDLIPVFMDLLAEVDAKQAKKLSWEYRKLLYYYTEERIKPYSDEEVEDLNEQASYLINDVLFEALGEYCPPYTYFGSHPGDGADFGVWVSDSIEDDVRYGELVKIEDLAELDEMLAECKIPKNVLLVNDHGNMTLYTQTAKLSDEDTEYTVIIDREEVWSIV